MDYKSNLRNLYSTDILKLLQYLLESPQLFNVRQMMKRIISLKKREKIARLKLKWV